MELFIIRHGQSIGNLIKEDMPDGELTELGRQQAAEVCEGMKTANVAYIVSSPLMRAIETAQPLARWMNLPIEVWKDTCEVRSKGPYKGPSPQRLAEMYPETVCGPEIEEDGWFCSGDDTEDTAAVRAKAVYARLRERFMGKRVALFAHSGFNRHLLLAALGLSHHNGVSFHNDNGSIFWLTVQPDRTVLNYVGGPRVILEHENVKKPKLN
ncbi:histidine phosphatase family protein [Paenibacillus thalictri]|uniref:Histidine phosphatase family protein n=1 Tax=Paenibacillus thalictri TaxID=2527873 RepID=A0A4Q9E0J4_9BACL|nr:histidine phosphatase family protein [Paenibacillus thalictri]TBL81061.1 histidine phosphatase family protein [Paenibacillus thalictri]